MGKPKKKDMLAEALKELSEREALLCANLRASGYRSMTAEDIPAWVSLPGLAELIAGEYEFPEEGQKNAFFENLTELWRTRDSLIRDNLSSYIALRMETFKAQPRDYFSFENQMDELEKEEYRVRIAIEKCSRSAYFQDPDNKLTQYGQYAELTIIRQKRALLERNCPDFSSQYTLSLTDSSEELNGLYAFLGHDELKKTTPDSTKFKDLKKALQKAAVSNDLDGWRSVLTAAESYIRAKGRIQISEVGRKRKQVVNTIRKRAEEFIRKAELRSKNAALARNQTAPADIAEKVGNYFDYLNLEAELPAPGSALLPPDNDEEETKELSADRNTPPEKDGQKLPADDPQTDEESGPAEETPEEESEQADFGDLYSQLEQDEYNLRTELDACRREAPEGNAQDRSEAELRAELNQVLEKQKTLREENPEAFADYLSATGSGSNLQPFLQELAELPAPSETMQNAFTDLKASLENAAAGARIDSLGTLIRAAKKCIPDAPEKAESPADRALSEKAAAIIRTAETLKAIRELRKENRALADKQDLSAEGSVRKAAMDAAGYKRFCDNLQKSFGIHADPTLLRLARRFINGEAYRYSGVHMTDTVAANVREAAGIKDPGQKAAAALKLKNQIEYIEKSSRSYLTKSAGQEDLSHALEKNDRDFLEGWQDTGLLVQAYQQAFGGLRNNPQRFRDYELDADSSRRVLSALDTCSRLERRMNLLLQKEGVTPEKLLMQPKEKTATLPDKAPKKTAEKPASSRMI